MRKRVSMAPWWWAGRGIHGQGLWAFNHNRKRYTAPFGSLKPPENLDDPKPTHEALKWHRAMMEELEPGWPHRPLIQRRLALSQAAANKLEALAKLNGSGKSELLRLAIGRIIVGNQAIPDPVDPKAVEVPFKFGVCESDRLTAMCRRRKIPQWWVADHAIRSLPITRL